MPLRIEVFASGYDRFKQATNQDIAIAGMGRTSPSHDQGRSSRNDINLSVLSRGATP